MVQELLAQTEIKEVDFGPKIKDTWESEVTLSYTLGHLSNILSIYMYMNECLHMNICKLSRKRNME